jgi:uncharacterized glyoxalase superfamily protein PhnB
MLKGSVVPVLRMFDVPKALEFYDGFLGFKEDWQHKFEGVAPVYMQMSRDGVAIHLTQHHGDACPGAQVRIEVADVDAYCATLLATSYGFYRPHVDATEWETREMSVLDPFGNKLVFWTPARPE